MIPLSDSAPRYTFPAVTIGLIAANTLVFLYQLSLGELGGQTLVAMFGLVPAHLAPGANPPALLPVAFLGFLTSMFLHGGWLHLIGNMWFLWIFGDNVEDRFGHLRFLIFYLVCGIASAASHVFFNWGSTMPVVGASGAIAGVLGAYIVLFPGSRVRLFLPWFFLFTFELPAWAMLGYWFLIQLVSGSAEMASASTGGVAWWAHVGGFITGLLLVRIFARRSHMPYYFES